MWRLILLAGGQPYKQVRKISADLDVKNVNFIDPVPYGAIPEYIRKADVVLGIFGNTGKALRAVPNKVYDAIAMSKAVITAETPAVRELFSGGDNCLFCRPADRKTLPIK